MSPVSRMGVVRITLCRACVRLNVMSGTSSHSSRHMDRADAPPPTTGPTPGGRTAWPSGWDASRCGRRGAAEPGAVEPDRADARGLGDTGSDRQRLRGSVGRPLLA